MLQDGFCYINNKCIPDGSTDEDNNCNICNANRMKYEWSFNPGKAGVIFLLSFLIIIYILSDALTYQ